MPDQQRRVPPSRRRLRAGGPLRLEADGPQPARHLRGRGGVGLAGSHAPLEHGAPASPALASLAASVRSVFLALASGLVGMEWVAIGATRVSPPESMRAGVKPVQPASYHPMRGPGKDDIHEAISPVSTTIAQTVGVLAWLSMPKTAEYSDMGPRGRGRRAGRRLR